MIGFRFSGPPGACRSALTSASHGRTCALADLVWSSPLSTLRVGWQGVAGFVWRRTCSKAPGQGGPKSQGKLFASSLGVGATNAEVCSIKRLSHVQ